MEIAYSVVNRCLTVLRNSKIPLTKRLKIEIALINVKRYLLMLDDEAAYANLLECIDLSAFYEQFKESCCSGDLDLNANYLLSITDILKDELKESIAIAKKCKCLTSAKFNIIHIVKKIAKG